MASLFPLQGNRVRIVAKAAAFGFVLANAWIETLDAQPISPPPGLVSWWPGDRNAKDIIDDNDGLLKGGASFGRGLVRQAFRLDGVNGFVLVPDRSNLRFGTSDFTVDLWVNFRTTDGEQIFIEKWVETFGPASQGWSLTKLEGNTIQFATGMESVEVSLTIDPNTWYFIAVSRSGDNFTIYWNGVPVASESFSVNLDTCAALKFGHRCNPEDTPSCAPGILEGCSDDRGFFLNGLIDEVEIFSRALSEDEILAIFEAGRFGKIKPHRQ